MINDKFNFFMPFDIVKSEDLNNSEEDWRIAGYASSSDPDRQDEVVVQNGLDISDFLNFGFLNYDHNDDEIIGYPDKTKTKLTSKGFWVEGILLKEVPLARKIWETAVALKKSNADRKLGFSVEGKIMERDNLGRIIKAKIYHVAVTATPVNTCCTFDALCKSLSNKIIDKSMKAGYSTNVEDVNSGSCLKTEDLESSFRTLAHKLGDDSEKALKDVREFLNKSLDANELTLYFQLSKGIARKEAKNLVENLQKQNKEDN